jgi:hypothetical protein
MYPDHDFNIWLPLARSVYCNPDLAADHTLHCRGRCTLPPQLDMYADHGFHDGLSLAWSMYCNSGTFFKLTTPYHHSTIDNRV